jgi:hypothetical protein
MTVDIWLTLLNAVWGLVLTGIGIEMVNRPPTDNRKKWLYRIVFMVFGIAVIVTTGVQSVRSANEQQRLQKEAQNTEKDLSNQLSSANGKLDAISHFEGQFLTFVTQQKGSAPDPAAKAYEAMALTVLKMAQAPSPTAPAGLWQLSSDQRGKLRKILSNKCSLIVGTKFGFEHPNDVPLAIALLNNREANAFNFGSDLQHELSGFGCGDIQLEQVGTYSGGGIDEDPFVGVKIFRGYTAETARVAQIIGDALNIPTVPMGPEPKGGHYQGIIILIGNKP